MRVSLPQRGCLPGSSCGAGCQPAAGLSNPALAGWNPATISNSAGGISVRRVCPECVVTPDEVRIVEALAACRFLPGSSPKRFLRQIAGRDQAKPLRDRQRVPLGHPAMVNAAAATVYYSAESRRGLADRCESPAPRRVRERDRARVRIFQIPEYLLDCCRSTTGPTHSGPYVTVKSEMNLLPATFLKEPEGGEAGKGFLTPSCPPEQSPDAGDGQSQVRLCPEESHPSAAIPAKAHLKDQNVLE